MLYSKRVRNLAQVSCVTIIYHQPVSTPRSPALTCFTRCTGNEFLLIKPLSLYKINAKGRRMFISLQRERSLGHIPLEKASVRRYIAACWYCYILYWGQWPQYKRSFILIGAQRVFATNRHASSTSICSGAPVTIAILAVAKFVNLIGQYAGSKSRRSGI